MRLFYFFSLLLCLLSVAHNGFSQGGMPDYSRPRFARSKDTVFYDAFPYRYIDKKLNHYISTSTVGHALLIVGFGNVTQIIHPLFTRIPARREFDRLTYRLEGRPIYGLNAEKMNEFSTNLFLAKEEFRKIRNTNTIALFMGLGTLVGGASLIASGVDNGNGGSILGGVFLMYFGTTFCIQIPPFLNRNRAERIQNYLYNASEIQQAPSLQRGK